MGLLLAGLGAAGGNAADLADQQIKIDATTAAQTQHDQTMAQYNDQLAAKRAEATEALKFKYAQQVAENEQAIKLANADRFSKAHKGLLDQAVLDNLDKGDADAGVPPLLRRPRTVDDLANPDAQPTADQKINAMAQAGLMTATMTPTEAGTLLQKTNTADLKFLAASNHDASREAIAAGAQQTKALLAAFKGKGDTDFDKKIALLQKGGATDTDISNFIIEKKQPSLEDLAGGILRADPNVGTKKAMSGADAVQKALDLRAAIKAATVPADTPKPAPAAPVAAPSSAPVAPAKTFAYNPVTKKVEAQ